MASEASDRPSRSDEKLDRQASWFSVLSLSSWWLLSVSGLLAGLTAAAYSNTLDVPFIFDDIPNIKYNELIFRYREFTFDSFKRFWISRFPHGRPVSLFTFALNYCFGRHDTTGYHVVNLLIHVLTGIGVFCFTRFLLCKSPVLTVGDRDEREELHRASLIAGMTALFWTLHPVQTQSVTYIVQRMTSLAGLFYFWGLYFYLRRMHAANQFRKWGFFVLVVLFFFLGIGSKEIAATFPVAIWLLHWLFFPDDGLFGDRSWIHLTGIVLFFGAVAAYFLMGKGGVSEVFGKLYRTSDFSYRHWSTPERLMTEARVVVRYLWIILLPFPSMLSLERNPEVSTGLLSPFTTLTSVLFIVALLYFAWRYRRRYPVISFSILWFGLHLMITSTVLPLELMYDHRLYLPLFGPVFLIVYKAFHLLRLSTAKWIGIGLTVSVLLGGSTYARNQDWSSWISIYQDATQKVPGDPRAHGNLASGYNMRAEELLKKRKPDEAYSLLLKAKQHFKRAQAIAKNQNRPKHLEQFEGGLLNSRIMLAMADLDRGNVDRAFAKIASGSDSRTSKNGSGSTGLELVQVRASIARGAFFQAIKRLFLVIQHSPGAFESYNLLVAVYLEKDQPSIASAILDVSPKPESVAQHVRHQLMKGKLYMRKNQQEASLNALERALSMGEEEGEEVSSKRQADVHIALARYYDTFTENAKLRNEHARKALLLNSELDAKDIREWAAGNE